MEAFGTCGGYLNLWNVRCDMDINFERLKYEVMGLLRSKNIMVLATSSDDRVTARSVSCVVLNCRIYFQTDKIFLKCEQIVRNPNVALCVDNIQIEGNARIKGHPFGEENKVFIEKFKKVHNGSFNTYSHMKNEVVVEIEPLLITLWKYRDGRPFRDFLDLTNRRAHREYYDNSK
ncbi:MAG TPA: pyridoxamine 5'-phosphate oxidase [Clostridiaceae bacterium]|nr:pyridoxamine 5'-phosphate oxidase [Clostridiaceae bacterium]